MEECPYPNKKTPVLALTPDYAFKPLQCRNDCGLHAIAFYEALKLADMRSGNSGRTYGEKAGDDPWSVMNLWLKLFKRGLL